MALANGSRRIGTFDLLVSVQRSTVSVDAAGQREESWATVAQVWAREVPQRGNERFLSQQIIGRAVVKLELREYVEGVTVLDRIDFRHKLWDIHDVRPIGRDEGQELDCTVRSE